MDREDQLRIAFHGIEAGTAQLRRLLATENELLANKYLREIDRAVAKLKVVFRMGETDGID